MRPWILLEQRLPLTSLRPAFVIIMTSIKMTTVFEELENYGGDDEAREEASSMIV